MPPNTNDRINRRNKAILERLKGLGGLPKRVEAKIVNLQAMEAEAPGGIVDQTKDILTEVDPVSPEGKE